MLRRIVTLTAQRCRGLSRKANVVKSRFPNVDIPRLRVDEYIFNNLEKWADKTALECLETGRKISYHQLQKQSLSLAKFLRGPLGLSKGDTIAVILKNVPEYAVVLLGGSIAGLKVTTINPLYTSEEIKRQLVSSDSKLAFTLPELWGTVSASIKAIPQKNDIPVVVIKHKSSDVTPTGTISFSEILENNYEATLDHIDLKDTFLLPYSSGTTGLPKGVALTHNSLVANLCQTLHPDLKVTLDTDVKNQDVIPLFLPIFHLYGLAIIMLGMLSQGCKLVTFPKYGTQALVQFCEQHKATVIHAVPPIVLALIQNPAIQPKHLQTVRTVISGAAPLGAADVERFHKKTGNKIDLIQLYGLTETSPVVTLQSGKVTGGIKIGGSGLLVPNAECKVVPVNDISHPGLKANESGELLFRGPQNMKGYHNNEQATQETLVGDGWLKTGDIGYYDEDGHFFITDRLKELIKVKGFQVAPAELEEVLRDHPCVADAAVVGVPDDINGEAPKAFVVLKNDKKVAGKDIDDYVSSKVTEYKRLRGGIVFLDSIPKTPSGKILRRHLKLM